MSTTTSQFQIKPDFFPSVEACLEAEKKSENTNPRYKFFTQTHFTAGDTEQFETYRDYSNGIITIQDISLEKNTLKLPNLNWEKYRELDPLSVSNTFNYIFHKFKKGIFIKIKNGKLSAFLPFSKKNFSNEWYKYIQIEGGNIYKFFEKIQGSKFNPNSINKFIDSWYANNCLLRWEFPIYEGDTNVPIISDMFRILCEERKIPDMEFFVNRRDFPILKEDGTEPYDHLFGDNTKLLSHSYDKYSPILSMIGVKGYADIPIPTGEDWARVTRKEGKFFPKTATRDYLISPVPWAEKKPIAVFRGASTGCGVTIETNTRLKISNLSKTIPPDTDGNPLLDAGITEWNLRPRKIKGQRYLQTIDINSLPFGLVNRLTPQEQAGYKYIININGHVAAYRLSLELEFGSCILLAESKYKLWYQNMLKPFIHYVPVKEDLSDIIEKIRWCKANDYECEKIGKNASKFASTYLSKNGILNYLQKLLYELKKVNGIYFYHDKPIRTILEERELEILRCDNFYPKTNKQDIYLLPVYNRSYGFLKGVEWLIHMVMDKKRFFEVARKKGEIFNNKITVISEYEIAGIRIVEKVSSKRLIHETFVATQGTNHLLRQIPNFAYTFGFQDNSLLIEYIPGETFNDFIYSKNFNIPDYLSILIQLSLALHVAQKKCGFVHHDLTPWNIILQRLPNPITFDYIINYNTVYRINTSLIPIIIDMGRSHIIHDSFHYGEINLFSTSTIQDIITILNISIYEISKLELKNREVKDLITLANFLSHTEYRRKSFKETGRNGLGDIRYFFGKAKKYSEIVSSEKYDLERRNPIDFINYILANFKIGLDLQITDTLIYHMNHDSPRQVFNFALSSTQRERAFSYIRALYRIQIPKIQYLFQAYHMVQTITNGLISLKEQMIRYLHESKIEDREKFVTKYENTFKFLNNKFRTIFRDKPQETFTMVETKHPNLVYEESSFLFPDKILYLLHNNPICEIVDTDIFEVIEEIMLCKNSPYALLPDIRKYYESKFQNRPDNYITDVNTLWTLSQEIFTEKINNIFHDKNDNKRICNGDWKYPFCK